MKGIFLDLETSGLDPRKHQILEVALRIVDLDNLEYSSSFTCTLKHEAQIWKDADPESLEVNGFSPESCKDGIPLQDCKRKIMEIFSREEIKRGKAVFICQNPSFDRAFFTQIVSTYEQEDLLWPYHWLDLASMFWMTFRKKEKSFPSSLSKDSIANYLKLPPEEKPHKAMNGVDHLLLCFKTLLAQ